jgi:hypothetical protein
MNAEFRVVPEVFGTSNLANPASRQARAGFRGESNENLTVHAVLPMSQSGSRLNGNRRSVFPGASLDNWKAKRTWNPVWGPVRNPLQSDMEIEFAGVENYGS